MNEPAWLALKTDLESGRVAHAYAFYGEEGLGQDEILSALAAGLLCARPGSGGPGDAGGAGSVTACGTCADCVALSDRSHPDLMELRPDGASVKLEAVRSALAFLHRRPFQASRRLLVIHSAERLTAEAANALLKVLEEPPAGAVLVLVASSPDAVLATVRSRCRAIAFPPLPLAEVADMLVAEGADPAPARAAAALSGGNPGRARAWLADPGWPDAVRLARAAVLEGIAWSPADQATWSGILASSAQAGYPLIDWVSVALRDALAVRDGADPLWLSRAEAASLAGRLGPEGAARALVAAGDARAALRANVTARLTFEVFCLRLARAAGGR